MEAEENYRIKESRGKGHFMVAARALQRGERILTEQPLVTFHPIPADMVHPHHFLTEGDLHSGKRHIKDVMSKQTPEVQNTLRALKRHGDNDINIVATNAFTHLSREPNGVNVSTPRVYHHISHINHSCRPNALVEWNESLKRATVHALTTIPNGVEIMVDYMADVDGCLHLGQQRRDDLLANYKFECKCGACRRNNAANAPEDQRRLRAKELYTDIFWTIKLQADEMDEPDLDEWERVRVEQIGFLTEYIGLLEQPGLNDFQLTEAYEARAKYHEQGAYLAGNNIIQDVNAAGIPPTVRDHLAFASEDWKSTFWNQSRIFGRDHPWTERTSKAFLACQTELALLP